MSTENSLVSMKNPYDVSRDGEILPVDPKAHQDFIEEVDRLVAPILDEAWKQKVSNAQKAAKTQLKKEEREKIKKFFTRAIAPITKPVRVVLRAGTDKVKAMRYKGTQKREEDKQRKEEQKIANITILYNAVSPFIDKVTALSSGEKSNCDIWVARPRDSRLGKQMAFVLLEKGRKPGEWWGTNIVAMSLWGDGELYVSGNCKAYKAVMGKEAKRCVLPRFLFSRPTMSFQTLHYEPGVIVDYNQSSSPSHERYDCFGKRVVKNGVVNSGALKTAQDAFIRAAVNQGLYPKTSNETITLG